MTFQARRQNTSDAHNKMWAFFFEVDSRDKCTTGSLSAWPWRRFDEFGKSTRRSSEGEGEGEGETVNPRASSLPKSTGRAKASGLFGFKRLRLRMQPLRRVYVRSLFRQN